MTIDLERGARVGGREKPIPFSAPMVRALIRETREPGTGKTQHREIVKLGPMHGGHHYPVHPPEELIELEPGEFARGVCHYLSTDALSGPWKLPYAVGDRLWVKEAHRFRGGRYNDGTEKDPNWSDPEWFRVSAAGDPGDNWDPRFPSGWSPSWSTPVHDLTGPEHDEGPRVVGMATSVRSGRYMPRWASRLTLIVTEARVERLKDISEPDARAEGVNTAPVLMRPCLGMPEDWHFPTAREAFRKLWGELHGAEAWAANPWIVAVTFRPILSPIDALPPESSREDRT